MTTMTTTTTVSIMDTCWICGTAINLETDTYFDTWAHRGNEEAHVHRACTNCAKTVHYDPVWILDEDAKGCWSKSK